MINEKFPPIGGLTAKEVEKRFLAVLKSAKLNIKYVSLVNIRETAMGLVFYIKTKNFLAVGEYDEVAGITITAKQLKKINKKIYMPIYFSSENNWLIK